MNAPCFTPTQAQVWSPGQKLYVIYDAKRGILAVTGLAAQGQRVIRLDGLDGSPAAGYVPGQHNVQLFINGMLQTLDVDYIEIDEFTLEMVTPLTEDQRITALLFTEIKNYDSQSIADIEAILQEMILIRGTAEVNLDRVVEIKDEVFAWAGGSSVTVANLNGQLVDSPAKLIADLRAVILAQAPSMAQLAAPGGSNFVTYESGRTVQSLLDNLVTMQGYAQVRAYSGRATGIRLTASGISGLFYRDPSDLTSVDNGVTVLVDAIGRVWKRDFDGAIDIKWAGALGTYNPITGVGASNTEAIQKVLNLGGIIKITPGNYNLDDEVKGVSGTTIRGEGGNIYWTKPSVVGDQHKPFEWVRKTGISVYGLNFFNKTVTDKVVAIHTGSCELVRIKDSKIREAALLTTYALVPGSDVTGATYPQVTTDRSSINFNCCYDIEVDGVDLIGRGHEAHTAAVNLFYALNWKVSNVNADEIIFGVQWWGGDSNHSADGAITNERKCKNGTIYNVTANNGMAGVWGSMGDNIKGDLLSTEYHTDVGIDPEGCFASRFMHSYSAHCNNGCVTGFFFNRDVEFSHITAYQDGTRGTILFKTYNSSNATVPFYQVNHCIWKWGGATGFGVCVIDPGIDCLEYCTNEHLNVIVYAAPQNQGFSEYIGNKFVLDRVLAADTHVLSVGGNHGSILKIIDNEIRSRITQTTAGTSGINVVQTDFNSAVSTFLERNTVIGFELVMPIRLLGASANGGVVMQFNALDNKYQGTLTDVSVTGRSKVRMNGNRQLSGELIAGQSE